MTSRVVWRILLAVALVCIAAAAAGIAVIHFYFQPRVYQTSWPEANDPESVGFDSERLSTAGDIVHETGAAAVVVVVNGKLLAAWGDPARSYPAHSVRKSLLNALYGRAIQRGQIGLDESLLQLGIDDVPPLTVQEKTATIRHLLTARSGVYHKSNKASKQMLASLPKRDAHRPGEYWLYQNWPYNALGTIFERKTGRDIFDAFHTEIARPLGFEHFDPGRDAVWEPDGYSIHPAYDFRVSALDLARFGQLYLNGGIWNGNRLIPEAWIRESLLKHSHVEPGVHGLVESKSEDTPGYGYLWWIETAYYGTGKRSELANSYSAEGMGGHLVLVAPEVNIVIVIRANTWLPAWTPFQATRLSGHDVRRIIEAILDARTSPIDSANAAA